MDRTINYAKWVGAAEETARRANARPALEPVFISGCGSSTSASAAAAQGRRELLALVVVVVDVDVVALLPTESVSTSAAEFAESSVESPFT